MSKASEILEILEAVELTSDKASSIARDYLSKNRSSTMRGALSSIQRDHKEIKWDREAISLMQKELKAKGLKGE